VFELWDQDIGAQAALCGGGRYDGLAEAIGGSATPGVGVGIGVERIVMGLKLQGIEPPAEPESAILVAHFGGETKVEAVRLGFELREAGISSRLAFARNRRSIKSQMREADRHSVKYTAILGESELESGTAMIRRMSDGQQIAVPRDELIPWLENALAK
jgi:histidyl-tRNA synthetase